MKKSFFSSRFVFVFSVAMTLTSCSHEYFACSPYAGHHSNFHARYKPSRHARYRPIPGIVKI